MKKGFTIVELMVVIALIGLFSFLVISSIDNAREKGRDSEIQSLFASLRAQSERFYSKNNKFLVEPNSLCNSTKNNYGFGNYTGPGLFRDIADVSGVLGEEKIIAGNESPGSWDRATCHASIDYWVVEAPMPDSKPDNIKMYCQDNTSGILVQRSTNIKGYEYTCPGL